MLRHGMWISSLVYPDRNAEVETEEKKIRAAFHDRRYTVVKLLQDVQGIQPDWFYRINYYVRSENIRTDVLYIWQDSMGTELSKGRWRHLCGSMSEF